MFKKPDITVLFLDISKKQFTNGKWVQGVPKTILIESRFSLVPELFEPTIETSHLYYSIFVKTLEASLRKCSAITSRLFLSNDVFI